MSILWADPSLCVPPHRVTHQEKCDALVRAFERSGWGVAHPILVGYLSQGRVQLLSGSHRWAAAREAKIQIPVMLKSEAEVYAAYGDLDAWHAIMQSGEIS